MQDKLPASSFDELAAWRQLVPKTVCGEEESRGAPEAEEEEVEDGNKVPFCLRWVWSSSSQL